MHWVMDLLLTPPPHVYLFCLWTIPFTPWPSLYTTSLLHPLILPQPQLWPSCLLQLPCPPNLTLTLPASCSFSSVDAKRTAVFVPCPALPTSHLPPESPSAEHREGP